MDFNVWDQRLKIFYFIPHAKQDLSHASPFGMYTPGLHTSSRMFLTASIFPADVRELFSTPESVLHLRLKRLLWRHVVPIDIDALQQFSQLYVGSLFRVVLTNESELAQIVDNLEFVDKVPFMHVSSVEGQGRVPASKFNLDSLLEYVDSVIIHLSGIPDWQHFIAAVKDLMPAGDRQSPRPLELVRSHHNVTTPNEFALMSYGWVLEKDDPLVREGISGALGHPQRYIDRICLGADTVSLMRQKLMANLPAQLLDYAYLITVPSLHWSHYRQWRGLGKKLDANEQKALRTAYKNTVQQSTYFDNIVAGDSKHLLDNKIFRVVMQSRMADMHCYTAGLTLLSSSTLTPVLRLEPKVNQIRGELKILAHCVRSGVRIRSQYKQSRLARVMGKRMRDLIDGKFLSRLDLNVAEGRVQGLKVVSDIPLEWLPCAGLPLGMRYDLSRIPVVPGNLFLKHCVTPPVHVSMEALSDILIIRSFHSDDQLKPLLEQAIDRMLEKSEKEKAKVRIVDVGTEDELINALEEFTGAILIFDGHGNYEYQFGIGTIVVGGEPVDVWNLKSRCQVPPIVIFSACDTHPLDGSHSSCANAAFTLGARTVLATSLPINAGLASMFIARLIYRIIEFVPIALEIRVILTWREIVSGMLRMSYTSEITRLLIKYEKVSISEEARNRVQLAANTAINDRQSDWFETYVMVFANESNTEVEKLRNMVMRWASLTDAQKYVQLGSPENVVITKEKLIR